MRWLPMWRLALVLATSVLVSGDPVPLPRAEPEPEAQADPQYPGQPPPVISGQPQPQFSPISPVLGPGGGALSLGEEAPMTGPGGLPPMTGPGGLPPMTGPGAPSQCGMEAQCCGMADQNCCPGGQQCYTYYENVCEDTKMPYCRMVGKEFCNDHVMPDCRISRGRGRVSFETEYCAPTSKQECFNYNRTICDKQPTTVYRRVDWQNDMLQKTTSENKTQCEQVQKCNYTTVNEVEVKTVPVRECNKTTVTTPVCTTVPITKYRVVERVVTVVQYTQQCWMVTQPACNTGSCSLDGCTDGGAVCSMNNYNTQSVCAQNMGTGAMTNCQQVQSPVCSAGPGQSCDLQQGQQCCNQQQQRVCRQVPQRVPMRRNVTVPYVEWKQECQDIVREEPNCVEKMVTQNVTKTKNVCNEVMEEECYSYQVPKYNITQAEKSQKVGFTVYKCNLRQIPDRYCHTFPQGTWRCQNGTVEREYIVNKVVCDRTRSVKFCRIIPQSECQNVPQQKCKVVPRRVCQPGCSNSPQCNQCDNFRRLGGLQGGCPTGNCNRFYPIDPFVEGGGGGNQGFNPGNGGNQWFNPGSGGNQGGFNPGNGGNEGGFNPGNGGDQWFNPGSGGSDWFNPGGNQGGFNPGGGGGQGGFNPGGSSGFLPERNNPGHEGHVHFPVDPGTGATQENVMDSNLLDTVEEGFKS